MGTVAIVDYGVGNLKSVANALSYLGCSSCITADPAELERADAIILPGVGAFPDAADRLRSGGLDQHVLAQGQKKPVLGICRGIQVMNVVLGGTLYLVGRDAKTHELLEETMPCSMCKRLIINAGISTVIVRDDKENFRVINVADEWIVNDETLRGESNY